jgi:hypothetical protein
MDDFLMVGAGADPKNHAAGIQWANLRNKLAEITRQP